MNMIVDGLTLLFVAIVMVLIFFRPVMGLASLLTPWRGFILSTVRRHNGRYTTLHLSIYDYIGHLSPRRGRRFHKSFLDTLQRAIQEGGQPVYFASHLMRPAHMKSMTALLKPMANTHCWRQREITIPRHIRWGIRLQMLIQEWRWIPEPETGVLVVIRTRKAVL